MSVMALLSFLRSKGEELKPLIDRCVSIDLEVNPKTAGIFDMAAVTSGGQTIVAPKTKLDQGLNALEKALSKSTFVLGHNVLRHDIEHLFAARPGLAAKMSAPIDTLWLNPLAFPRHPYHHLVKHYHDGRLQTGHVNDPEKDARQVFDVLKNQIEALSALSKQNPSAVLAYHYLTTCMDRADGFDAVFKSIRNAVRPDRAAAFSAVASQLWGKACDVQVALVLEQLADPKMA